MAEEREGNDCAVRVGIKKEMEMSKVSKKYFSLRCPCSARCSVYAS